MSLFKAVQEGKLQRVQELINRGADINVVGIRGETALIIACLEGYTDITRF